MRLTVEKLAEMGFKPDGRRLTTFRPSLGAAAPVKAVEGAKTRASGEKPVAKAGGRKNGPSEPERIMERHLGILKATKLIMDFSSQPRAFRLADDCEYTVDFMVECLDGTFLCIETKGPYKREDGIMKLKWAAANWPEWLFVLAERHGSRSLGYNWKFTFRQGRSRITGNERKALLKRIGHLLP